MLAYVFWHRGGGDVERHVYEHRLGVFHQALAEAAPKGFIRSSVHVTDAVPWVEAGSVIYEDWYLLEDSAALDAVNAAAVSGRCAGPHAAVAANTTASAAGIYTLRAGEDTVDSAPMAIWLHKPPDMSYPDFDAAMVMAIAEGGGLWRRQMVLGPTPEFCLLADDQPFAPSPMLGAVLTRERLWPT